MIFSNGSAIKAVVAFALGSLLVSVSATAQSAISKADPCWDASSMHCFQPGDEFPHKMTKTTSKGFYGNVDLDYAPNVLEEGVLIAKKRSCRNDYRKVRVKIVGFDSIFDKAVVQKQINTFNRVYAQCGIELADQIPYVVFSSANLKLNFECYPFRYTIASNAYWGMLMKRVSKENEIPIIYLEEDNDGWGAEINKGCVSDIVPPSAEPDSLSVPEFHRTIFPEHSVFLANARSKRILESTSERMIRLVFSHELGHILFKSGHTDRPFNLMKDIVNPKRNLRAGAITKEQCQAAREFIDSGYRY